MERHKVKSVTVEYENGDVETFQVDAMWHIRRRDFFRGAKKSEEGFVNHAIRWLGLPGINNEC